MLLGFILVEGLQKCPDLVGIDFAFLVLQRQDLVTVKLHRAGLVGVNMAGGGADHTLKFLQHRGNHDGVGLGAAHQKLHICLLATAGFFDLLCRAGAVGIAAVAGLHLQIGVDQLLQHLGVGTGYVITFKGNHNKTSIFYVFIIDRRIAKGNTNIAKKTEFAIIFLKECAFMKKILIITSSPRKNGNSNALAKEFARGALEAGNTVQTISVADLNMEFCRGCMTCNHTLKCVINDDMKAVLETMKEADVIAFATPVYYYSVSGQLKTFFDRTSPLFAAKYRFTDVYLLATAADEGAEAVAGTETAIMGWIDCYPGTRLVKTVFAGGVDGIGKIAGHKALQEAFETGKSVC